MDLRRRTDDGKGRNADNKGHRYQVDRDKGPTPAEYGLQNPQACVGACFDRFVDSWSKKTGGRFKDVCMQLSQVEPNTELWNLYCCDSTFCGVWIGEKGQSPSVDLIINKCQGVGNYLIYDPGPPPSNAFSCSSVTDELGPSESGLRTILSNDPSAMTTVMPTPSTPAVDTSISSSHSSISAPDVSTGLTEGSKAAIGICASLAIIAIIFLVGFLINRQRSRRNSYFDSASNAPRHGRRPSSEPPSGSRTPLITPLSSPAKGPLTPPARLSDRRFLPSLLKQGTPNTSLASGMDGRTSVSGATSTRKPAPRYERRTTTSSIKSPFSPSLPAAVHFAPHFLRSSGSSYNSEPGGASTITTGSNNARSVHSGAAAVPRASTPTLSVPLSPTRSPRPHNGALEIPHLVTPAGPPPSRALPAPPPYHPVSPTFSVSPVLSPASPSLSVRPLVRGDAYDLSTLAEPSVDIKNPDSAVIGISLPTSTKDPRGMMDPYAREVAESWGSWNGGGGGRPGVTMAVPKKKAAYEHNMGGSLDTGGDSDEKCASKISEVSLHGLNMEKSGKY